MADEDHAIKERFEIVDRHVTQLRKNFDAVIVIGCNIEGNDGQMVWSDYGPEFLRLGLLERAYDQLKLDLRQTCSQRRDLDDKDDDDA